MLPSMQTLPESRQFSELQFFLFQKLSYNLLGQPFGWNWGQTVAQRSLKLLAKQQGSYRLHSMPRDLLMALPFGYWTLKCATYESWVVPVGPSRGMGGDISCIFIFIIINILNILLLLILIIILLVIILLNIKIILIVILKAWKFIFPCLWSHCLIACFHGYLFFQRFVVSHGISRANWLIHPNGFNQAETCPAFSFQTQTCLSSTRLELSIDPNVGKLGACSI